MVRKIEQKHIRKAFENKGNVVMPIGFFEKRKEMKTVKVPVPVIGRIFPFIKHKVKKLVETDKTDLVVHDISAVEIISRLKTKSGPENLRDTLRANLAKCPYTRMFKLDPKIYGDGLLLARYADPAKNGQCYDILTEEGVILGRFDMKGKGYYSPDVENALLPKQASESMDRHSSCEPISLEEIIGKYCAKNPDTIPFIPKSTIEKFPELKNTTETNKIQTKISNK